MSKYFQVYEYNNKLKARLVIFQLREKSILGWEEVNNFRTIEYQDVTLDSFPQYFKDNYLTEHFYEEKSRWFHELKLAQMTVNEYITKFTSLLRYASYLRDEKAKVQMFMSSLTTHMKEWIEFVNPRTMDKEICKAKGEVGKSWQPRKGQKRSSNFKGARGKIFKNSMWSSVSKKFGRNHQRTKWSTKERPT